MRNAYRPGWNLRHAYLAQLVEQRPVADLKPFRCLLTVPAVLLEHFEDDLALQVLGRLLGNVLERDRFAEVDLGDDAAGPLGHRFGGQRLSTANQNIAADEIFELADISRPVVVLHEPSGATRE